MKLHFLFLFCLIGTFSCRKKEELPLQPHISNARASLIPAFSGKDSTLLLTFDYTDGDGDLGFQSSDTLPPFQFGSRFYHNLLLDYYEKRDGEFVQVFIPGSQVPIRYDQRIPYLTPEGRNKAIKGEITVEINLTPFPPVPEVIKFKMRLLDRSLNESNEIETGEIQVNL